MRFYVTLKNTAELLALYRARDLEGLTRLTVRLLRSVPNRATGYQQQASAPPAPDQGLTAGTDLHANLRAVAAPSFNWRAAFVVDGCEDAAAPEVVPNELIVAYEAANADHVQMFLDFVNRYRNVPLDAAGNMPDSVKTWR